VKRHMLCNDHDLMELQVDSLSQRVSSVGFLA